MGNRKFVLFYVAADEKVPEGARPIPNTVVKWIADNYYGGYFGGTGPMGFTPNYILLVKE